MIKHIYNVNFLIKNAQFSFFIVAIHMYNFIFYIDINYILINKRILI